MTFDKFMKLPLGSRKRIEQLIVELDKDIQDAYGFSMLDTEKRLTKKLNEEPSRHSSTDNLREEKNHVTSL